MRIELTEEAAMALREVREKILKVNSGIDKRWPQVTSQVIIQCNRDLNEEKTKVLAGSLTTINGKRKALLKTLESITDNAGEDFLNLIDRNIQTLKAKATKQLVHENLGKKDQVNIDKIISNKP